MDHWIGVVSLAHVTLAVEGGYAQMNHGRDLALKRMRAGDALVMYSPRLSHPDGEPLQAFTALGRIRDGRIYQRDMGAQGVAGFMPWCMDVDWRPCRITPIRPLLGRLDFITDLQHWGNAFRYGHLHISAADFARIEDAMTSPTPEDEHPAPPPTWPEPPAQGQLF